MKVLLTGGGTGGHITPLLAVAQKLKHLDSSIEIIYVGERGSKFASMTAGKNSFDSQYKVFAGKFRRYNGESWVSRLLDIKTNLLNIRDVFYVLFGTIESWFLLRRLKPDVILLKGGFVGVPVGLAARNRIPMVTHDSDALPGLANRLVSRWAVYHATGMPLEFYNYPKEKARFTGVLVGSQYQHVNSSLRKSYKRSLHIPDDALVLVVTGGSLGSQNLNDGLVSIAPDLLERVPNLWIIHQVGRGNQDCYGDYRNTRLQVMELLSDMYRYTGAADVVITRAGANTLAELGVQAKACIVVPNPLLTGGHQLINAEHLRKAGAVIVVDEDALAADPGKALQTPIQRLLTDKRLRSQLGEHFHKLTVADAAQVLAELLIEVGERAGK